MQWEIFIIQLPGQYRQIQILVISVDHHLVEEVAVEEDSLPAVVFLAEALVAEAGEAGSSFFLLEIRVLWGSDV